MSDQDTPIPGVETFIRTSKESVLAKGSHSLDFLDEDRQRVVRESIAPHWVADMFVVLYSDGDYDTLTEAQWEQRKTELRGIEQVVEAPRVHLFEMLGDTEIPAFIDWAQGVNPGVGFSIPPVGTITIARGGRFELFVPEGKGRPEIGHPEGYFDEQRAHNRLSILNIFHDLDDARAAEKWVLGEE